VVGDRNGPHCNLINLFAISRKTSAIEADHIDTCFLSTKCPLDHPRYRLLVSLNQRGHARQRVSDKLVMVASPSE